MQNGYRGYKALQPAKLKLVMNVRAINSRFDDNMYPILRNQI